MNCCICKETMIPVEPVFCATEAIGVFDLPHAIQYKETMLFRCPDCSHMQIENGVEESVYENEYHVDYSNWNTMKKTDEVYFAKLSSLLKEKENIFEIGCGEGRSLEVAQLFFENVYGIEPAETQARIAQKRIAGTVFHDFFSAEYRLPVLFDAFYSKMVFEHLENPVEILKNMYLNLKPGGVGWINVPNGQKIYNENLYELFSFVHIQYFTPLSISYMVKEAGFEVLEISTHAEEAGEVVDIDIVFRKPEKKGGLFSEQKKADIDTIKKYISPNDKVTVWGAGTKAHKYIELFDNTINIKHIIDKGKQKQGKYISKLNLPIENISEDIIHTSDVIVIFASLYNEDIIKELKKMKYNGKILFFENGSLKMR